MEVSTIVSDYEVASDTCGDLVGTYFYERTYSYGLVEAMDAIRKSTFKIQFIKQIIPNIPTRDQQTFVPTTFPSQSDPIPRHP